MRSSSATAAPTASTASSPPGSAPPTPAAARPRSSPATSGCCTTSAAWQRCARSTTPVRIVVIDNDGGGIFHFLPQEGALASKEFEALLGTPRGVDAAKAAALFDLPHRRLESLADLPEALAAGTGLIEVRTDRQVNVELHRRLAAAVAAAISS